MVFTAKDLVNCRSACNRLKSNLTQTSSVFDAGQRFGNPRSGRVRRQVGRNALRADSACVKDPELFVRNVSHVNSAVG